MPPARSHVARTRTHAILAPARPFLLPCDLQRARAHSHEPTQPSTIPPPPCRRTTLLTLLPRWRSALEEARLLVAEVASRDSSTARLLGTEPASDTRQTGSGRLLGKLRPASTAGRFVMGPPEVLPPIGAPARASLIRERTEGGLDIVMGGGAEAGATGGSCGMQPPAFAPPEGVTDTGRILPPPRMGAPKGNRKTPVRTRVGFDEPDEMRGGPSLTRVGDGEVAPPSAVAASEPRRPSFNAATGKAGMRASLTMAAKAEKARNATPFEVGSR